MKSYFNKIPNWIRNKYTITIVVFLLFIILLDDNNVFYQYKLLREEKKLEVASKELRLKIKDLQKTTNELQKNPLAIERIAREKYGMKKDDETIFVALDN